jgi:hypothetical protein
MRQPGWAWNTISVYREDLCAFCSMTFSHVTLVFLSWRATFNNRCIFGGLVHLGISASLGVTKLGTPRLALLTTGLSL